MRDHCADIDLGSRCMWRDSSRSPRTWHGATQHAMWMVALFLATALILVPAFAFAQVITGGGTINQNPNGSYSASFTVTGTSGHIYDFSSSCTGYVTSCGVPSPEGLSARTGHLSATATVTDTTGSAGSGTLTFQTFDESTLGTVSATLNVSPVNTATPSVTADDNTWYTSENASTNYPHFHITNSGNTAASYTLSYSCSGNVSSCSVSSPSPTIAAGSSADIAVYYHTGPFTSGNATVGLSATSPYSETASKSITVVPLSEAVSVSPKGGTTSVSIPGAQGSVPFTVTDIGNSSPVTYHVTFSCSGVVTTCPSPYDLAVASGLPETRYPQFWVSPDLAGGTGTFAMTASIFDGFNTYSDYGSYTVTVPDTRTYNVAVTPTVFDDYTAENVSTNYVFTVTNNGN